MSDQFIKGGCTRCGGHIEFPAALAGSEVKCPHCAQLTKLLDNLRAPATAAEPAAPPAAPARPMPPAPAPKPSAAPTTKPATSEPPGPKVSQECPGCGLEVSIAAEECPGCGAMLKEKKRGVPVLALIAGAVVLVLAAGGFFLLKKKSPGDTAAASDSASVEEPAKDEFSMKAPERTVTLSGKFELLDHRIDRMPGRNLVYVTGTVTNGTPQQAFAVKITFDMKDDSGADAGQAQDQIATLPSGDAWEFRALVLDGKASQATLSSLEKDME